MFFFGGRKREEWVDFDNVDCLSWKNIAPHALAWKKILEATLRETALTGAKSL